MLMWVIEADRSLTCVCPECKETALCSAAAYLLEWELVNLLIVMMSTQLYTPTATAAPQAHPFTAAILEQRDLVPGLLQVSFHPSIASDTSHSIFLSVKLICS